LLKLQKFAKKSFRLHSGPQGGFFKNVVQVLHA